MVAASTEDAAALRTSLHELLARIGTDLELERATRAEASAPNVDGAHRDFATVGVDLEADGETRVVVADAKGEVRMHRSVSRGGDRRVAIEEAAHVVQGAIEALEEEAADAQRPIAGAGAVPGATGVTGAAGVAGASGANSAVANPSAPQAPTDAALAEGPVAVPPASSALSPFPTRGLVPMTELPGTSAPHPPASAGPVPPAHPMTHAEMVATSRTEVPLPKLGLDVFSAFSLGGYGSGSGLVLGGEAGVVLHDGIGSYRPSLWFFGDYHASFTPTSGPVAIDVTAVSLHLMPAMDLVRARTWRLEAAIGGGIDVLHASPRTIGAAGTGGVRLEDSRTDVDPIVSAMVAVHSALGTSADLFAGVRLDADLAPPRYQTESGGVQTILFDPWRVRPALVLGVTLGAFGPTEYPARTEPTR